MESQPIDTISQLLRLRANAESRVDPFTGKASSLVEGYLMGIRHAIELAELQQGRHQEGN